MATAMTRTQIESEARERLLHALAQGLHERIQKHGAGAFVSAHEGLGAVVEEYDELVDAVRANDTEKIIGEAMDLAVAALWMLASQRVNEEAS